MIQSRKNFQEEVMVWHRELLDIHQLGRYCKWAVHFSRDVEKKYKKRTQKVSFQRIMIKIKKKKKKKTRHITNRKKMKHKTMMKMTKKNKYKKRTQNRKR